MARILRKFVRLEAEVEAREGRLPLGQRLENCKLERGMRTAETPKDDIVAAISMAKSGSEHGRSYLQEKS